MIYGFCLVFFFSGYSEETSERQMKLGFAYEVNFVNDLVFTFYDILCFRYLTFEHLPISPACWNSTDSEAGSEPRSRAGK